MSIPFGELRGLVQDPRATPEALVYACLMAPMGQGETWVEYTAAARPTFRIHKSDVSFHDIYEWGLSAAVMLADHFKAPGHACALFGFHAVQLIRRNVYSTHRRAVVAWGEGAISLVSEPKFPGSASSINPIRRIRIHEVNARLDSRSANMSMPPTHLYTLARADYSRRFKGGVS